MSLSQLQEQGKFKKHLSQYWASKGITQIKIPQIGGQQLNLYKLYRTVCKKGGGQMVSHNKLWKQIVDQFGLPSTCTSASFTLKNHYQKYLLGYQQRFFFGKEDSVDLPELVAGRQRKPIFKSQVYSGLAGRLQMRSQGDPQPSSLSAQLKKYYDKNDPNQTVHYIKRTKIYPVMAQVKHLIMAFQSGERSQIMHGINTLLIFSVNTQAPFLFNQYPYVLEAIYGYFSRNYPPKDLVELECLRTLTVALRNLLMTHKNLQAVLQSQLLQVLVRVFQQHMDRQMTRNVADMFGNLTRVGLDFAELAMAVSTHLEKDSYQDIQTGLDLLRVLVQQKQDSCQEIILGRLDYFARLLVYSSVQIREAVLQILAFVSDRSQRFKRQCLGNFHLMDRLFACMSSGTGQAQKQAQYACFIISNIAQLGPQAMTVFKGYQRTLLLVSCNDENLSPVVAPILFALSGREQTGGENAALVNMRMNMREQMEEEIEGMQDESVQEQDQASV